MPEEPQTKWHEHPRAAAIAKLDPPSVSADSSLPAYAELHCLSNFSFLRGASHPEELVTQAHALGYSALAITDRNSLAGIVRAHVAAKQIAASDAEHLTATEGSAPPGDVRQSFKLIIGAEITPLDSPPIVLLAPDRAAYGRLCRLITRGRLRAKKGDCTLRLADVCEFGEGMIGIVIPEDRDEETKRRRDAVDHPESAHFVSSSLRRCVSSLFLAAPLDYLLPDAVRLARLAGLARELELPLVATNQVLYHAPQRRYLQDVLACIREKCTIQEAGTRLSANAERHLRPRDEILRRYAHYSDPQLARAGCEALQNTIRIASQCTFTLDELRYEYPHELVPAGRTAMEYLEELTWRGAAERYGPGDGETKRRSDEVNASGAGSAYFVSPSRLSVTSQKGESDEPKRRRCEISGISDGMPAHSVSSSLRLFVSTYAPKEIITLLDNELALIAQLKYEHYFLTVYDLCRYARSRGILCQGRGSAANSAVCYVLGVTAVDPVQHDLLFERFISQERNEPPDIDVDFEHERREEVFQYIYEKYGRERAAITAEVITYRPRSAIRDVGKALGLSLDRIDVLTKSVDWYDAWRDEEEGSNESGAAAETTTDEVEMSAAVQSKIQNPQSKISDRLGTAGFDPADRTMQMIVRLVRQILGFPRHLSQHVGGFVMTQTALCEIVPLENGAMPDRTFIEWDKNDIDAVGLLKVDCLALGMLTAISRCFAFLKQSRIQNPKSKMPTSLVEIPDGDQVVYDMICAADTIGVFQIESRAQMSMLPRLRPRYFYDLVIEVAIVRPGPIQGGMVHPFLRRRDGLEHVTYPSEAVKKVLYKTLGVPLFQEQAMRLAVVAAGFTPGEADQLRRAMAAWRRGGAIEKFQRKLILGMIERGYSKQFAEQLYKQILGFGEYGFPESHAASFAILVYASCWLKRHHPAAFLAAMLNSQPLGFYTPGQLIRDAIAHGVPVLPVDVNYSCWDCTLEKRDEGTKGRRDKGETVVPPSLWGSTGPAVRLGLRTVRGLSGEKTRLLEEMQQRGPIRSIRDCARAGVFRATLLHLAAADAFRSLGLGRRQALWQILALDREDAIGGLFAGLTPGEPPIELPETPLDETVVQDYDAQGFSLNAHPMELVRSELDALAQPKIQSRRAGTKSRITVIRNADLKTLKHSQRAAVSGLVTVRQRPGTAKGITFMTLEDETGMANLIVRPDIWERDRTIARGRIALIVEGNVERQGEVIHVMVRRFHDLAATLREARADLNELRHASRDFH